MPRPRTVQIRELRPRAKLRPDGLRVGSAGGKLVDAVCEPKGATHRELCELLGWKQCMPFVIKVCAKAKVRLHKKRQSDGQVRYFGTRA